MPSCDFFKIYQWVRRTAVRVGGGGGGGWRPLLYTVVRGFCTLMSVATMIDVSAMYSNKIEKIGASIGFEPFTYEFHPCDALPTEVCSYTLGARSPITTLLVFSTL